MNYSVNPKEFGSIFALPSSVVDDHIKLASVFQLKALLLFVRNQNESEVYSLIGERLGLSEKEVFECLDYWVQRGILISENSKVKAQEVSKPTIREVAPAKPTRRETTARIENSEQLKYLLAVAQEKFGRLLTSGEMSTFVWLFDTYGLPVPVIILAMQYAYDSGKLTFGYLQKVCVDWAKNDIDTVSKAEERLNELYLSKTAWKITESAFGIEHRKPSASEKKYVEKWVNEFGFNKDMLEAAYDICINNTSKISFRYINTILESWHKKGWKKPTDIVEESPKKDSNGKKSSSFDLDELKNNFNNFD